MRVATKPFANIGCHNAQCGMRGLAIGEFTVPHHRCAFSQIREGIGFLSNQPSEVRRQKYIAHKPSGDQNFGPVKALTNDGAIYEHGSSWINSRIRLTSR